MGGRIFDSPHGHRTHPMSEKMRGAIFNALGDITGLSVLDAYAGSGAIGFETVSRGAISATLVEADKAASKTIKINIHSLALVNKVTLISSFVMSFARRTHDTFDIVVADPPYDALDYKDLEALPSLVKPGGILVYSLPPSARLLPGNTMALILQKDYGDATLSFYRRQALSPALK